MYSLKGGAINSAARYANKLYYYYTTSAIAEVHTVKKVYETIDAFGQVSTICSLYIPKNLSPAHPNLYLMGLFFFFFFSRAHTTTSYHYDKLALLKTDRLLISRDHPISLILSRYVLISGFYREHDGFGSRRAARRFLVFCLLTPSSRCARRG